MHHVHVHVHNREKYAYGVASISRIDKIVGLFCKRAHTTPHYTQIILMGAHYLFLQMHCTQHAILQQSYRGTFIFLLMGTAALHRVCSTGLRQTQGSPSFPLFRLICAFCVFLFSTPASHPPLLSFLGHSALPPPRGGSASRVSPQSCQSHESLWGS